MIKKITNWTFGSIFRTIGRFLAYLLIGIIIALFFVKKEYVKATTYTTEVRQQSSTTFSINNTSDFTCQYDFCDYEIQASDSAAITSKSINISNYNTTQYDVVAFNFVISNPISTGGTQSSAICTEWQAGGTYYNCSNITQTGQTGVVQNHDINNLGLLVKAIYSDNSTSFCSLENNKIYCPTFNKQISTIEIIANQKTRWITYILVRIYRVAENYKYISTSEAIEQQTEDIIQSQENQTQQIIENQENQTQQQIESQMVCQEITIDINSTISNGYITGSGGIGSSADGYYKYTDYIEVSDSIKVLENGAGNVYSCFYTEGKELISCIINSSMQAGNYISIPNNTYYARFTIRANDSKPKLQIKNCKNGNQAMSDSITSDSEDAESGTCGIICKLKKLIQLLSIDNIKYLVIPTEEQMNDLFEQMQEKITSKLGILGLPVTVYTRLMQIAMQYEEGGQNWCLQWNAVPVPNFEEYNIIQAGEFCFSDILQNEKINNFRNTCQMIIGGLILLSFVQYLFNCLHRILDVPIQDNYEYFTTEDVYGINTDTGEVESHTIKSRTTTRRPL